MILGTKIFNELDQERTLCITGHLSGGKTRLGFELALPYWRNGYRVLSNVPHNFINKTGNNDLDLYRSFLVVDEPGEYIREAKDASAITRSAGKADYYAVFTGKRLPHKNLQDIVVEIRFNFWENYGIPLILWRANVRASVKYKIPFWQVLPQAMHGTYSTRTSSGSIQQLLDMAQITVEKLARSEGQEAGQQKVAGIHGFADHVAESFEGALS